MKNKTEQPRPVDSASALEKETKAIEKALNNALDWCFGHSGRIVLSLFLFLLLFPQFTTAFVVVFCVFLCLGFISSL